MKHDSIFRRPTTIAVLAVAVVGLFGVARFGTAEELQAKGTTDDMVPPAPENQTVGRFSLNAVKSRFIAVDGTTHELSHLIRLDTATGQTWFYIAQETGGHKIRAWVRIESQTETKP